MDGWPKTWFAISGKLERINFKGLSDFRFPEELARLVISKYSEKGDLVFDPFCGFGTTLVVARKLNREAIGFEIDKTRADFARRRSHSNVINDNVENLNKYKLPKFDLLLCSPPYLSLRYPKDPEGRFYLKDIFRIFKKIKPHMKKNSYLVVEVANLSREKEFRPQAWNVGLTLSKLFTLEGEVIRANTSEVEAGGNNNHSYLLIFQNR